MVAALVVELALVWALVVHLQSPVVLQAQARAQQQQAMVSPLAQYGVVWQAPPLAATSFASSQSAPWHDSRLFASSPCHRWAQPARLSLLVHASLAERFVCV